MPLRWLQRFFLLLILVMLCVPVLAVMGSWLQWDAVTADILQQMGSTVLPDYAWTTLRLCVMVGLGEAVEVWVMVQVAVMLLVPVTVRV